ncbi:hypothetical protein NQ315_005914 [Exocentrus adspersus]|uniref:Uncharacterized protein n=1 Tax=Exocentrus adspersus TaxID=1586481 RepID=A0AAV8VDE6_9CUCU|nr:hypothetical protein NQ315_005914 [Exocentrus adspersus]
MIRLRAKCYSVKRREVEMRWRVGFETVTEHRRVASYPAISNQQLASFIDMGTTHELLFIASTFFYNSVDSDNAEASTSTGHFTDLLGKNPNDETKKGPPIHEESVVGWSNYLKQGITVDIRKDLISKYSLAENCPGLKSPKMNEEVRSIITNQIAKNDTFFSSLQDQLGAGLSVLGSILTQHLNSNGGIDSTEIIQKLSDAAQLFLSEVIPLINEEGRLAAQHASIDEYLFGSGFLQKVTSTKTVKKASNTLKNPFKPWTIRHTTFKLQAPLLQDQNERGAEEGAEGHQTSEPETDKEDHLCPTAGTSRDTPLQIEVLNKTAVATAFSVKDIIRCLSIWLGCILQWPKSKWVLE